TPSLSILTFSVYWSWVKVAVTYLGASIITEVMGEALLTSPLHPANDQPGIVVALRRTSSPQAYLVLSGCRVTVPVPTWVRFTFRDVASSGTMGRSELKK